MSFALAKAAQLKPEIRLARAVSEFEAALSDEQKDDFRSCRSEARKSPPAISDITRLMAELDRRAAGKGYRAHCFGQRFDKILRTVQQFAVVGNTVIDGSQNIIASGVWSLVRMTLLLVVNFHSYFEKLSAFLMTIGRSAPCLEMMTLLYPQSSKLQSYLFEYFIVIVNLCHHHLKLLKKSTFGQFISFLSEADLKAYQSDTDRWASSIKEEVNALMAKEISEQSSRTKDLLMFSKSEARRKKSIKAYYRILDACSTYDYQKAWKDTRKAGYTTLFSQASEYHAWKAQTSSCTLVYTGKLGSGKSVLLANMVDDLNLSGQAEPLSVAYFFCRYDNSESLKARTIMGCLARQLLGPPPGPAGLEALSDTTTPTMDLDAVTSLLCKFLPPRAYAIIDGLDECDNDQMQILIHALRKLQNESSLRVCISFRIEADTASRLRTEDLVRPSALRILDDNPDVEQFITAELERRIESGELKIGEPRLILEIRDSLVQGAHGMFLWVALQIESLCAAKTDEAIRQALADLPRDLPTTFTRILRKSEKLGKEYQEKTLKLVIAARRPLTTDELGEALSVKPGDTDWDPARLLNDVYSALACCGSIVTVNEEDFTVQLVHHSAKQFLIGSFGSSSRPMFTFDGAMRTMRHIVVTYLNYGVFDTQLSTAVAPQVVAATAPLKIMHSTMSTAAPARLREIREILRLLKPHKQSDYNAGPLLMEESKRCSSRDAHQFHFFPYAKLYCLHHLRCAVMDEPGLYKLVIRMLKSGTVDMDTKDEDGSTLLEWATRSGHGLLGLLLCSSADQAKNSEGMSLLHLAARSGDAPGVQLSLDEGANIEAEDPQSKWRPMHYAANMGHEAVVRLLLEKGANKEAGDGETGSRPLHLAAKKGHEAVIRLLLEKGADKNVQDNVGSSPLHLAAHEGHEAVVRLLLKRGANKESRKRSGWRPMHCAASMGHEAVVRLLSDEGANIEAAEDEMRWRPLHYAARSGHDAIVRLLLERGAYTNVENTQGSRPLHNAAKMGYEAVIRLLLLWGADINVEDQYGRRPLHYAADEGYEAIVRLLLEGGADKNAESKKGLRPLHYAAGSGREAVVRLLLEEGADKEAKNQSGESPLDVAKKFGYSGVERLLQ